MREVRRVALLIESSRNYGRGLLRGISTYVQEHGYWSFLFRPQDLDMPVPSWLGRWDGDGVIARVDSVKMAKALRQTGLPVVDLRNSIESIRFPAVGPDNRAIARLATDHFLQRGFRHFAFCGMPWGQYRYMDRRREHLRALLEEAGLSLAEFELGPERGPKGWDQQQDRLAEWVAGLPKPVAVIACNDDHGVHVVDACQRAEQVVPEEVAVLGVDDDQTLCTLCTPPLSSINIDLERIGYEAAALLDRLMAGGASPDETIELAPRGIVVRHSTDVLATDDRDVARAVRFIRERACEGIQVSDVVNHVMLSRSSLERRFRAVLGRPPGAEIRRVQLDRARELLTQTTLPLSVVALRSGFQSLNYFFEVFQKTLGTTPTRFRRRQI
ncbi:MAG: DNA-binding transcriptional regulator [Pirellulales bacterium]|nr:DNA-binding transcriptional regulator [Pirellulales bacterium]